MTFLEILKIVAAIVTLGTGLISLIRPRAVQGFTGLTAPGPRGVTEMRSVLGGTFIGLGAVPLIVNQPVAYQMLGAIYLTIALARIISFAPDRSFETSNLISLVSEILFGIILIL